MDSLEKESEGRMYDSSMDLFDVSDDITGLVIVYAAAPPSS